MRTPHPWELPRRPVTTAALLASGVSESMIATQLRSEHLVRLRKGVYLSQAAWPDDAGQRYLMLARAEQVANPDGVISFHSAAAAWGLPHPGLAAWHDWPPSITLPSGQGYRGARTHAVHHVAALAPGMIAHDELGYPITSIARTAVDLVADLPLPEALVILDAAARKLCAGFVVLPRRRDFGNPRLVAAARQALIEAAPPHRSKRVAAAIAVTEPARESAAESLSAGHFHLAGLPIPLFQPPIPTVGGTFYPDCLWKEQRLIGECDGAVKYADGAAIVAEKEREQILRDLGFGMVRWLAKEIMLRPSEVVARVARALG